MIHIILNAFEAFLRKKKALIMTLKEHNALDFTKTLQRETLSACCFVFFAASQNDHISLATIQFCREIQHLNTFCMFS